MKARLTIEKKDGVYIATLFVDDEPHKARDLDMFTAAHTAYYYALPDYPGLEFPLLDLMGAFAAENDLDELCEICTNHPVNLNPKIMCAHCQNFSKWSRA